MIHRVDLINTAPPTVGPVAACLTLSEPGTHTVHYVLLCVRLGSRLIVFQRSCQRQAENRLHVFTSNPDNRVGDTGCSGKKMAGEGEKLLSVREGEKFGKFE